MIGFDRRLATQVALIALALLWPALLFGHAAYFPDTMSYYRGGDVAVHSVASRLVHNSQAAPAEPQAAAAGSPGVTAPQIAQDARGARSIPYSIMTYLLAGPGRALAPLVVMQALMTALVIATLLAVAQVPPRARVGGVGLIAVATPAAWFTGFAMPDIFAGVLILGMALLFGVPERISGPLKAVLLLMTAFAITAHTSHIGIALAMLLLMVVLSGWAGFARHAVPWRGLALNAAVVGLAVLVIVVSGYIGFGEVSLAAKRYPFALSRALDDDTIRHDLETVCRRKSYMLCRLYPAGLPPSGYDFLWGPRGVSRIATSAQMDVLRQEEEPLLLIAARASPAATERHLLGGFFQQLVTFGLEDADYERPMVPDASHGIALLPGIAGPFHAVAAVIEQLSWASVVAAAIALASWLRPRNPLWPVVVLVLVGMAANAAICASFSGVAARYQARVIWLLPLCAVALAATRKPASAAQTGS